ncbi:MAG: CGNR zinc finger domain-containing protein [Acidobacteriaceae bacterium]|nr:CGNR zinc finger domain-containing protein [Acidobacteriaceae bacterium]MBV8570234.1 CGNR zinc finger domain-containing protein [Acidobacteriaceae bacterium]
MTQAPAREQESTPAWCSMNLCGNRAKLAAYAQRPHEKGRSTHQQSF